MKKVIKAGLMTLVVFMFGACGDDFKTVKIGEQTWMAENLNDASKGGKCYDDKPENCEKYGRLYTWAEAVKACPTGWHLPSGNEWQTLVDVVDVGGKRLAGEKLKAKSGWTGGNGTDKYGFSALPGGAINSVGGFASVGQIGVWWSATNVNADNARIYILLHESSSMGSADTEKMESYSLRCVKD